MFDNLINKDFGDYETPTNQMRKTISKVTTLTPKKQIYTTIGCGSQNVETLSPKPTKISSLNNKLHALYVIK